MEFISVTEDGSVAKRVVAKGTGDMPPLHARCVVHYVGRTVEDGKEFMNTKTENASGEPATLVAGRGKLQLGVWMLFTSWPNAPVAGRWHMLYTQDRSRTAR